MPDPSEPASHEPSASPSDGALAAASSGALARFAPGTVIAGKYRVERILGKGGIGIVAAARHLELEHTVAIKFLQTHAMENPTLVERFVREARLAAKIRSQHVVRVHDVGRLEDGVPYMVMEYLEGTDLARELEGGVPIPAARAVDYVLQACEALADAHSIGIIHRDLKPENLFLAKGKGGSSMIKLLDFGISKAMPHATDSGNIALTHDKDSFGTPSYMSPEQLRAAADVDVRADIWALGVVLHELLAADMPFKGNSLAEICAAVLGERPIPLSEARPDLPAGLSQVVDRCLQRDRTLRYRSVAQLAQDLRPFADAASVARIEHVVEVAREAGDSVRPPALSGEFPPISEMRSSGAVARLQRLEPTLPILERDPTTHNPTSASVPTRASSGVSRSKSLAIAGSFVVVAVQLVLLGLWLGRSPSSKGSTSSNRLTVVSAESHTEPLPPLPATHSAEPPSASGAPMTAAAPPASADPPASVPAPDEATPAPHAAVTHVTPVRSARPPASAAARGSAAPRPAASASAASSAGAKRTPPAADTTDLGAIVNPFE